MAPLSTHNLFNKLAYSHKKTKKLPIRNSILKRHLFNRTIILLLHVWPADLLLLQLLQIQQLLLLQET